ncbi:hypothetical protein [Paenibacillus sp.]|jgi:RNA-splicing ligase RtcB|uniref:hypothetical protein n=1 Tax=Paenibacillus sp. TaxID=58172 RepID=UPI002836BF06|nr:hypothetical protein [Paenibacillus sp.]MDR0271588.1 hypothetical protein [Paenibacillus sp.]
MPRKNGRRHFFRDMQREVKSVENNKNKTAASPGYKTPKENFNAEFAEEYTTTIAKRVSRNAETKQGKIVQ